MNLISNHHHRDDFTQRICAVDTLQKGRYIRHMLDSRRYEKDAEPPLVQGETNTTVLMWLNLHCATPIDQFVSIEAWAVMVSRFDRWEKKNVRDLLSLVFTRCSNVARTSHDEDVRPFVRPTKASIVTR